MSTAKIITSLMVGVLCTVQTQAQEADTAIAEVISMEDITAEETDTTTVEVRDFNGQSRQYRWQTAMWDKQKLGEWDEAANNRLTLRHVPDATMNELRAIKALQYDREEKPDPDSKWVKLAMWVLEHMDIIYYTFYGLLGALLLLAIVLFIRKSNITLFSRSRRRFSEEEAVEAAAGPQDYDALAQAAVTGGDYRGAVRMRYLQTLHILQVKELIEPGKDKTNMDYLRELSATAFHQPFAALTRHYEYIWYGKVPLSNGQFAQLDEQFAEFKKSLRY